MKSNLIYIFELSIAVATLLRTFLVVCFAYCQKCLCPNLCGDGYSKTMLEYRDQRAGIFYLNLEIFISTLIGSSNEK